MNCFNHPNLTAVAQCCDCSKGQCPSCATLYSIPICKPCNDKRIKNERSKIIKELLLTYIVGFVYVFFYIKPLSTSAKTEFDSLFISSIFYITSFYFAAGTVAGWITLNRITPRVFLFLPLIGWLIYFIFKFILSACIGMIMLPIRTFSNIRRLAKLSY